MPPKKIVTICILLVVLAGIIYTIAENVYSVKERQMAGEEVEASSFIEEIEPVDQSASMDGNEGTVEYRLLEEPEAYDSHTDEGESHNHEHIVQETETRTLNVKAPNFELNTLVGETVRLSDFKGRKVFINFWATWCPPCVEEMPAMQDFYEKHAVGEDIVILAVNATDLESNTDTVKQFVSEFGIDFPILLDEKGDVSLNYEVLTLPTSMIIDEEGMVTEQIIGPVTEDMLVEKLLD